MSEPIQKLGFDVTYYRSSPGDTCEYRVWDASGESHPCDRPAICSVYFGLNDDCLDDDANVMEVCFCQQHLVRTARDMMQIVDELIED